MKKTIFLGLNIININVNWILTCEIADVITQYLSVLLNTYLQLCMKLKTALKNSSPIAFYQKITVPQLWVYGPWKNYSSNQNDKRLFRIHQEKIFVGHCYNIFPTINTVITKTTFKVKKFREKKEKSMHW